MRLRHVCTVGIASLVVGVSAPAALADSTGSTGTSVGGATAPPNVSATGATGPTAATGTTATTGTTAATGSTGTSGSTGLPPVLGPPRAPIVLPQGQSPDYVYSGPVYVQTASGAIVPYVPQTTVASVSGGAVAGTNSNGLPHLLVPGDTAEIVHGLAAAPEGAPAVVRAIIWAANRIIGRPYVYGGGHASFSSRGYDCSGTVSFALHGGRLLKTPLDSDQFITWGRSGQGQWMTILTNPGHAYLDIAGLRLDTSAADDPSNQQGPQWRPLRPGNTGYAIRHPAGL